MPTRRAEELRSDLARKIIERHATGVARRVRALDPPRLRAGRARALSPRLGVEWRARAPALRAVVL